MDNISALSNQYDPVTDLPTRRLLVEAVNRLQKINAKLIMITVADAGHFNSILRALGHEYAEEFVRAAAKRIILSVPSHIEIFHVSVLSFVFICQDSSHIYIKNLLKAFKVSIICRNIPILPHIGLGLVDFEPLDLPNTLRKALSAAQDSRQNEQGWAEYNKTNDDAHIRSFQLLSDFSEALKVNDQLSLVYQPKVNLSAGICCGVEALLRWSHPTLGNINPSEFIPLVESTALVGPMTEWVLQKGAQQLKSWNHGDSSFKMAINVSAQNLTHPDFYPLVLQILKEADIAPAQIELEFTESVILATDARTKRLINILRDEGISIAIDDFGTGFSNLSYLTTLPADILKFDQSFIMAIKNDNKTAAIVETFSKLAQQLGYIIVAEGIEDDRTFEMLSTWRCDEGQGYFISKPLLPSLIPAWLSRNHLSKVSI